MSSRRIALLVALALTACAPSLTPPDPFKGASRPPETPVPVQTQVAAIPQPTATALPAVSAPITRCGPPVSPAAPASALVTIHFIDVGQGDSELIQTASGKTVLIDAGDRDAGKAVLAELKADGVQRIDLLLATHPHLDHIGGMIAVLDAFPVRLYVDPGTSHSTDAYKSLLEKVQTKHIPYQVLRAGKVLKLGEEASLTVLSPGETLIHSERSEENANSLVVKLTAGDFDALFTGDAEPETLAPIAEATGPVEVLKIAHHGSRWGTSRAFLDDVRPKMAVISCGLGNDYGHPHKETVELLEADCIPTFRTDRDGTVVVVTDGKGWSAHSSRGTTYATATAGAAPEDVAPSATPAATPAAMSHDATAHVSAHDASPITGAVVASKRGKVYHPLGCYHLLKMNDDNKVQYPTAADAEAAGLHAGKGCRVATPDEENAAAASDTGTDDKHRSRSRH